jgi:hypothetical protein
LGWYWKKFEALFESFGKRKLVESLDRRKLSIVGGLHGNMNFSGEDLKKAVDAIEENFREAVATIYGKQEEEVVLEENPFFGAMKLPKIDVSSSDQNKLAPYEVEVEVDQG